MSQDASVRIRLDTAGARADLAALYGDIRRAPAVSLPGGGAGGSGGGVGSGGFDMGRLLTALSAMAAGGAMVGAAGPAMMGIGRDALREQFLGAKFGEVRGSLAARDTVAQRFGLAYQLGIVSDETLRQHFDLEMQMGAGAAAQGAARAKAALGGSIAGTIAASAGELTADLLASIAGSAGELALAVKDLKAAFGGGP